jgi:hypothetical protein
METNGGKPVSDPETRTGEDQRTVRGDDNYRSIDLDNGTKLLINTAREYGLVPDDSPKYLTKLTVQFGEAPEGARLMITPANADDLERL